MTTHHRNWFRGSWLALAAMMLAGAAGHAGGQTVDELKQLLKEREAEILILRKRLSEALEGKPAPPTARPSGERAPGTDATSTSTPATVASSGKIAADDDAINRALERALIQRGDLLLPLGRFELQPGLSFSRADGRSGFPRSDMLDASLSLRAGMPWQSQLQISAPYTLRRRIGDERADGMGDVSLSVATQLLREHDRVPSLIGSLSWTAPTGRDGFAGGVPLGSGFETFGAGLTVLKRLDPLVVIGGISYSASRSEQVQGLKVKPGPVTGLRLGSGIAISPDTSFDLGLNLSFVEHNRIDGRKVPGSDDVVSTLDLGIGVVLSRRLFLRVGSQLRLTGTATDMILSISLPTRF